MPTRISACRSSPGAGAAVAGATAMPRTAAATTDVVSLIVVLLSRRDSPLACRIPLGKFGRWKDRRGIAVDLAARVRKQDNEGEFRRHRPMAATIEMLKQKIAHLQEELAEVSAALDELGRVPADSPSTPDLAPRDPLAGVRFS